MIVHCLYLINRTVPLNRSPFSLIMKVTTEIRTFLLIKIMTNKNIHKQTLENALSTQQHFHENCFSADAHDK